MGRCGPHLIHGSLSPPEHIQPKRHVDRFSRFCRAHGQTSLYFTMEGGNLEENGALSPKLPPSHAGIWTPCNIWFFEPTRVHNPNGISVCSAGFAGLTTVTNRQTDRQTDQPTDHAIRCVRIGRMYVHITAMRPLLAFFPLFISESVLLRAYVSSLKVKFE